MIKENDFVEIEFSAKTKEGVLVDTTKKEEAEKVGLKSEEVKNLKIPVGKGFLIKGLDKDIIGKEIGKDYEVEIKPEDAFGKRNPSLVKVVPISSFREQNIFPQKGMQFSFDGLLGKISSVSGGRVLVDFNNPLAGKILIYSYKIIRKIEDKKEQLESLEEFFFKKVFENEISEDKAKIIVEKNFSPLVKSLKNNFEEILNLKIEVEER